MGKAPLVIAHLAFYKKDKVEFWTRKIFKTCEIIFGELKFRIGLNKSA